MKNINKCQFGWLLKWFYSSIYSRILLFFIIGILIAYTLKNIVGVYDCIYGSLDSNILFWSILLIISSFCMISTLCFKAKEWIFAIFVNLFFISCGGFILVNYQLPQLNIDSSKSKYLVSIISEPIKKGKYYSADAEIVDCFDSINLNLRGQKIIVNFDIDEHSKGLPQLLDLYLVEGSIFIPDNSGLDCLFDYGHYLVHHGYCGILYLKSPFYLFVGKDKLLSFNVRLNLIRSYLINRYRDIGIDDGNLSVLTAMTLGDKRLLSLEQKSVFSAAGIQHILVVSGMHVGFLFAIIIFFLKRCRYRGVGYYCLFILGLLLIWGYASITGLAPAVVRASIMFSIMLLLYVNGDYYSTYKALAIAALISLVYNPYLVLDVGFILSYTAVLSISVFYPKFMSLYYKLHISSKVIGLFVEIIILTLSAQVLTFPIILYAFNQFPIYFLISNIISSFFTPILFLGGFVAILFSYIPYVCDIWSVIINNLLSVFQSIVSVVAELPKSTIYSQISLVEAISIYVLLFALLNCALLYQYQSKRFMSLVLLMFCFVAFIFVMDFVYIVNSNKDNMFVLKNNQLCVNFVSSQHNVIYSYENDTAFLKKQLLPLHLKHHSNEPRFITDTNLLSNYFVYKNKSYLVLKDNIFRYKYNKSTPFEVDYLIISRGVYPSEKLFEKFIHPSVVYLMPGIWDRYVPMFMKILDDCNIKYVYWGH